MAPSPVSRPFSLRLVKSAPEDGARPRTPSLDDSELLAAVRSGDPGVAGALYDRARPQVEKTVRRLLGRRDADVEDVAQMAMLELITTIDRYRGECSLDSWISTITAHVVYKHIRRRSVERQFFSGDPLDDGVVPSRIQHDAMHGDLVGRIREHLAAVEPNKAWTFLLHDVWGYDLAEIATITGASVAAAQSRLVRGRRELHERIAGDPELADLLENAQEGP